MRLAAGSLFLALAVAGSPAHAETSPPPACFLRPAVAPAAGARVPANLPAFLFQVPVYPGYGDPRPIAWHAIELREAGGTLVPYRVETFQKDRRTFGAILPDRPIATGPLVVSFLDDCPAFSYESIRNPPVRNDSFTYQVTAASPLPTRLGTAVVRGVDYARPRDCTDDTAAWVEVEVMLTPEALAFRDALTWRAATADGLELWGPAENVRHSFDDQRGSFLFQQRAACGPPSRFWRLGSGHSEVVYTVELYKGPAIEPARAPVDVDCAGVPDADVCAKDAAAVDGGESASAGGCACGVGISPRAPAGLPLLLLLSLLGLRGRRWRA
jgi:hypothetical protein